MITQQEFKDAANIIGSDIASIKAVYEVEAAGRGYLPDGRVKILFEGHRFWKQLVKAGWHPEKYNFSYPDSDNVLYQKWDKKKYKGGAFEWDRMGVAIEVCKSLNLSPVLALNSASYGSFQIMGENAQLCGYIDSQDMLSKYNSGGEAEQLNSFVRFVKSTKLDDELRAKNWAGFAQGYNGTSFALNKYDIKLAKAYHKYINQV